MSKETEGAAARPAALRVALVTGATSGIGLAIAIELARAGFRLVIHGGHDPQKLDAAATRLAKTGADVLPLLASFENEVELHRLAESAWGWCERIDVLVNNAGADLLTAKTHWSASQKLRHLFEVDVHGSLWLSMELGQRMRDFSRKHSNDPLHLDGKPAEQVQPLDLAICNLGWDQAAQGMAGESGILFAASKGSIMSMTRSLAQHFAPEVRVNCVAPGWIETAWGRSASEAWRKRAVEESLMQRWGQPEDIARAVGFLCSPAASFINGQVLAVNGGFRYGLPELTNG